MKNQTRLYLTMLGTLSFGSVAAAQDFDSSTISVSTSVGASCTVQSLPTASREVAAEVRALQSEADRMMCLSDGAAFATQLEGEVRVSVLAPGADGVLGITEHYLTPEDVDQLGRALSISPSAPVPLPYPNIGSSLAEICDAGTSLAEICDVGAALESADGRRLGLDEICDVGTSWHEICDAGTALESADGRRLGLAEICDVGTSWHEICDVGAALESADGRRLGFDEICDVGTSLHEICDVGTALESADGRRLGLEEICDIGTSWHEICDVGTSWSEICDVGASLHEICDVGAALTLGGQEGEPVRAVLDAMVSFTNAPDPLYEGAYKAGLLGLNRVGDDAQLANVDMQNCSEGTLPALWEAAYKVGVHRFNGVGDDAQLANVDLQNCNEISSGAQPPDNGLIAVVIITAVIDASN